VTEKTGAPGQPQAQHTGEQAQANQQGFINPRPQYPADQEYNEQADQLQRPGTI